MNILQLVKTPTGATWALRQMRELVKLGLRVHVALPPGSPLRESYQNAGVEVHELQTDFPIRRPDTFPSLAKSLRQLVDRVQPDLIHSHFVGTTLTMRLALGKKHPIPRVFQVPGPLHLEHTFFRLGELATAGNSDYWIGSCQWTCRRYQQSGIAKERIFLSYYGTDFNTCQTLPSGTLRKELGLSPQTRIVGMVAYLYAPKWYLGQSRGLKGHEDLIDALALCLETYPNTVGVFVGGAWNQATDYEQKVRRYARQKLGEKAIFLGTRTDVAALYQDFDVVVHPSHSENVGGAAESLMLKVPTIATNVGGFPDLVRPRETGWLVPPGNPKRLAEAIQEVFQNPHIAAELAEKGRTLAEELMSVQNTAPQVASIYHTILADRLPQFSAQTAEPRNVFLAR